MNRTRSRPKIKSPSDVAAGGSFLLPESVEQMRLNGSSVSQGALGHEASGRNEARWDPGSPSSAPASADSDSSDFAYFWCSYVEHSFLLIDTIPAAKDDVRQADRNVLYGYEAGSAIDEIVEQFDVPARAAPFPLLLRFNR